ncbi:PQQ-dependent sugar dehydrogenase [Nocardioides campestrisoli]|uniref:PQQ-dependent sugar dehydrogenase n=1 Tax=Nocardioides campestrisoli TaxID=2736757 RepID=UPI001CD5E4A7|nr:PQQ-dependent sugar dehydrogenase [Nocardioides campestrisoli]
MPESLRRAALVTSLTICLVLAGCGTDEPDASTPESPASSSPSPSAGQSPSASPSAPEQTASGPARPQVAGTVASGLEVPWGLAFLPDGSAVVTERDSARVLRLTGEGEEWKVTEVGRIEAAAPEVEGGLLGVAASPDFDSDRTLFFYVTAADDNRIVRAELDGDRLGEPEPVLTGIPRGMIHDGGRLLFGPDGYLYASTGEIGERELAQDRESLAGKILRITPDGRPAPGNPDPDSSVWSWGHRNVQGLATDDRDRLWASEFGDSTWDELNLVRKGRNYGWPRIEGRSADNPGVSADGLTDPLAVWSTDEASPSGLAYAEGSLWLGALRGTRLWQVPVTDDGLGRPRGHFVGDYGRLRSIAAAPDGSLWMTTSNRDGRGTPSDEDDRILRVTLER